MKFQIGNRTSYFTGTEKFYNSPRLTLLFKPHNTITFELTFNKMYQFLHQKNNIGSTQSSQNIWLLSSDKIPESESKNTSFGTYVNRKKFNISVNVYNKSYKNIFILDKSFYEAIDVDSNNNLKSIDLKVGTGNSFGLEFLLEKKVGILQGGYPIA